MKYFCFDNNNLYTVYLSLNMSSIKLRILFLRVVSQQADTVTSLIKVLFISLKDICDIPLLSCTDIITDQSATILAINWFW